MKSIAKGLTTGILRNEY